MNITAYKMQARGPKEEGDLISKFQGDAFPMQKGAKHWTNNNNKIK